MSTVTTQPISLTIDAVAAELSVSAVEVRRLIAKNLLSATKVGDGYRVLPANLAAYIASGAKNIRLADYKDGEWFDDRDVSRLAGAFDTAVIDAGQEQVPSPESIKAWFEANKFHQYHDYTLQVRGKVASVLSQAVPVSAFAPQSEQGNSRFASWSEAWAVEMIRRAALQTVRSANKPDAPIIQLYEGPAEHTKIVDQAYDTASKRKLGVFSKFHTFSGGVWGPLPVSRTTSYMLPASAILTPAAKPRLTGLAF